MRLASRSLSALLATSLFMLPAGPALAAPGQDDAPEPGGGSVAAPPDGPGPVVEPEPTEPEPTEPKPAEPKSEGAGDDRKLHDPMIEAKHAYQRGRELYDAAEYEAALGAFLDAQRLYASPDHHFNIARCYEALQRYELAVEYYQAYLRSGPADRANIEVKIVNLQAIVQATKGGEAPPPPPGADGTTTPAPGETTPTQPADETAPPGRALVVTGAVLAGVGVALAVGGGVGAGVAARNRSDQVDDVFEGGNPDGLQLEEARSLDDDGRRFEAIQIATVAVGGVIAATGAVLLGLGVRKNKRAPSARAAVQRGFAGIAIEGRF